MILHNVGSRRDAPMGHRVNVVIDDDAWEIVERIPKGERSRAINTALLEWAARRRRRAAAAKMDGIRPTLPVIDAETLTSWIREDRNRSLR